MVSGHGGRDAFFYKTADRIRLVEEGARQSALLRESEPVAVGSSSGTNERRRSFVRVGEKFVFCSCFNNGILKICACATKF